MQLVLPPTEGNARLGLLWTGNDRKDRYRKGFHDWLADNYYVFKRFSEEANKIRATGRERYSARTIAEFIRHETALSQYGGNYKLNNNVVPDMARLYADMNGCPDFFKERGR